MSSDNGVSGAQLMLAFLAGAVTGAAVALLATPQSGQQARESLKGWAHEAQGKATKVPVAVRQAYSRASTAAKDAFNESFHKQVSEDAETEA